MNVSFSLTLLQVLFFLLPILSLPATQKQIYVLKEGQQIEENLFKTIYTLMGILDFYEKNGCFGVKVDFENTGYYYNPNFGANWWQQFFAPIDIKRKNCTCEQKKVLDYEKTVFNLTARFTLSRKEASSLIKKYIHLRSSIVRKAKEFYRNHLSDSYGIGVHYEKSHAPTLQPDVSYDSICKRITKELKKEKVDDYKIFLYTDDTSFFEFLVKRFSNKIVALGALNNPLNLSTPEGRAAYAEEKLIACCLFTKMKSFYTTASRLGCFVSQLNPKLRYQELNKSWLLDE